MKRWDITDRENRQIYMTHERWEHIISKHHELIGHLDDVLDTIRFGRRKQERRDPQRYRYKRFCYTLQAGRNSITVTVVFSFQTLADGSIEANNFVTTAWGEEI